MKRKITEIYTEYDENGFVTRNLVRETVEEDDDIYATVHCDAFPYPSRSPVNLLVAECEMPEDCESCTAHCRPEIPDCPRYFS